jgi:hypothetical protein
VVPTARGRRKSHEATGRRGLKRRGFEVNVHDLTHDGHLFRNRAGSCAMRP